MEITSTQFNNNDQIPAIFTCDGENINPPLKIEGFPMGTQALALIVDDPDATSGDFVHWTAWNILPGESEIAAGEKFPNSEEGMSDRGTPGYTGPCPPSGTHHYHFKAFALDSKLNLSPGAIKEDLESAMKGHILDQTELVGLYVRAS